MHRPPLLRVRYSSFENDEEVDEEVTISPPPDIHSLEVESEIDSSDDEEVSIYEELGVEQLEPEKTYCFTLNKKSDRPPLPQNIQECLEKEAIEDLLELPDRQLEVKKARESNSHGDSRSKQLCGEKDMADKSFNEDLLYVTSKKVETSMGVFDVAEGKNIYMESENANRVCSSFDDISLSSENDKTTCDLHDEKASAAVQDVCHASTSGKELKKHYAATNLTTAFSGIELASSSSMSSNSMLECPSRPISAFSIDSWETNAYTYYKKELAEMNKQCGESQNENVKDESRSEGQR